MFFGGIQKIRGSYTPQLEVEFQLEEEVLDTTNG